MGILFIIIFKLLLVILLKSTALSVLITIIISSWYIIRTIPFPDIKLNSQIRNGNFLTISMINKACLIWQNSHRTILDRY